MLAFGIGANTAIFSVVNALLLRPIPVVQPDRLIRISEDQGAVLSLPVFREVSSGTVALRAVAATLPMQSDLDVDGDSHFAAAEFVTANYADVLGVRVSFGRWFVNDREPVAVISDAVWERQFARNPHVLGRVIRSGTDAFTIVGVAPREFSGVRAPLRTDFWAPIETRFRATTERPRHASPQRHRHYGTIREFDADYRRRCSRAPQRSESTPRPHAHDTHDRDSHGGADHCLHEREPSAVSAWCASTARVCGPARIGASRARLLRQLLMEALVLAVGGTRLYLSAVSTLPGGLSRERVRGGTRSVACPAGRADGRSHIVIAADTARVQLRLVILGFTDRGDE